MLSSWSDWCFIDTSNPSKLRIQEPFRRFVHALNRNRCIFHFHVNFHSICAHVCMNIDQLMCTSPQKSGEFKFHFSLVCHNFNEQRLHALFRCKPRMNCVHSGHAITCEQSVFEQIAACARLKCICIEHEKPIEQIRAMASNCAWACIDCL